MSTWVLAYNGLMLFVAGLWIGSAIAERRSPASPASQEGA